MAHKVDSLVKSPKVVNSVADLNSDHDLFEQNASLKRIPFPENGVYTSESKF